MTLLNTTENKIHNYLQQRGLSLISFTINPKHDESGFDIEAIVTDSECIKYDVKMQANVYMDIYSILTKC